MRFPLETTSVETPFDRQERLGWWRQEVVRRSRVMVVGAGALGNEALKNLALLGIGKILVVDFDTISTSNLSRTVLFRADDVGRSKALLAAERTRALALEPGAVILGHDADLVWDIGLGVFRRMDVILGCVDNDEARLAVNRAARTVGVPWINGGMYELTGSVTCFSGSDGACFECTVTADQLADAQSRYDSCEQVKKRYLAEERLATVQVTSAIVSGLQVQEAMKLLHGAEVSQGTRLVYNGATHGFHRIALPEEAGCLAHGRLDLVHELPVSARTTPLDRFLDVVEHRFGSGARVELGRRFLRGIRCRSCGVWITLDRPAHRIFDDEVFCSDCRTSPGVLPESPPLPNGDYIEVLTAFDRTTFDAAEAARLTLWDLGIPLLHILSVVTTAGERFACELSADAVDLLPGWDDPKSD